MTALMWHKWVLAVSPLSPFQINFLQSGSNATAVCYNIGVKRFTLHLYFLKGDSHVGIIDAVFGVFSEVAEWFTTSLPSLSAIFWDTSGTGGGSLTILGVMAVASLGISVTLLLFNYVKDLITMR